MGKWIRSFSLLAACLAASASLAEGVPDKFVVPTETTSVLNKRCLDCHGPNAAEGDVRFDTLGDLTLEARLDLLNRAQNQLFFGLMPPDDAEQPTPDERSALATWLQNDLRSHNASELDKKLLYPAYGNYVDHEKLFSGEIKEKAFTPARRWLISPQIFEERVLEIFNLGDRERENFKRQGFYGVTNPFVLPDQSGVRDYDISAVDGGHLLAMLTNADWISHKQLRAARVNKGEFKADAFDNPKDKWYPKTTPAAFEKIILQEALPTDEDILAAIQTQFDCVLQRKATETELQKYLELTKASIELGGNTEGLRQMLVSVLLEPEFLYRMEFGAGEPDEYGRKMLAPREACYAISYALGDRRPDPALVKAAEEGRLQTREDFKREVLRLLNDQTYYQGQIDKTLSGRQFQSYVTSHPKIDRFFREFFGYANALKVFKDKNRSNGYYENPDRGSTNTPGRLVNEADLLIDGIVRQDQHVFESLLQTEQFYVAPVDDAEAKIEKLNLVYEHFKDTPWKKKTKQVVEENKKFIEKNVEYRGGEKQLVQVMTHIIAFRDKGLRPNPVWNYPFGIHMLTPWVASYNIQAPTWDYPSEQPFKVANRKGILTHPAWLVAHSSNFHTDPIRRGRWIREKLLAGVVPDVPITVDAQVPDDPHKTFRERVELVTEKSSCWKCHQQMNPLGLAFEMYDDFGRFRTEESLEHPDNVIKKTTEKYGADTYKTKPVNTAGSLKGTGDPSLDGDVQDALDLIDRLAKSQRVRQSIIRHAFRFYLGRNEMLSDSQTLIDADMAYVESGGSFKAVIVSLLTSDSFLYRK